MPTLFDRFRSFFAARIGRRRHEPHRDTIPYARLRNIFSGWGGNNDRPIVKATPANLRRFSRTVYARRGINVIKGAIATRDWEFRPKKGIEHNPEIDRQIELATACFKKPNHDDSMRSFLEQILEDYQVAGAAAFEHQLGGDQIRPLWMWPVDALSIQIVATWNGDPSKPRYRQSFGSGNVGTQDGTFLRNDELCYIKADPSTDNPFGTGWVEVAFSTINRLLSAGEYAGNVAGNATPSHILFFEGLGQDELEAWRAYWTNEIEGQGKTPIVGGQDAKAVELHGGKDEALYLKWQEFLVRELACASGLSPQNFSVERDVNRDTAEVAEDRDWRQTIIPIAGNVESYINREVVDEKLGFSQIEFHILGLDREDELDTAKIYEIEFRNNAIVPNEFRERKGLPPMEGPWGDMTYADIQIAISAARGAKEVDDPELHPGNKPKPDDKDEPTRRRSQKRPTKGR